MKHKVIQNIEKKASCGRRDKNMNWNFFREFMVFYLLSLCIFNDALLKQQGEKDFLLKCFRYFYKIAINIAYRRKFVVASLPISRLVSALIIC